MMFLGSLAHDGFTSFGKKKRFLVHKAEHRLSGSYPELLHGQGIALLLAPYLKINQKLYEEKIIELGKVVFQLVRQQTRYKNMRMKVFIQILCSV